MRAVRLITIQLISDQTLANCCHFIEPNHRIKNLLAVKQLPIAVYYLIATGDCEDTFQMICLPDS
jgi:hypothetical protein